jgi:hypothetical protein
MIYRPTWDLTSIPHAALSREWMRRARALRSGPPRAKILAPCRWCGQEMGARDRRAHEPHCPQRPARG